MLQTVFVPLLSLIVESVSQLVANDGPDGSEVQVHGRVQVKEDTLENSGRKLHEILTGGVEGVGHCHELVLEPRLRFDGLPQQLVSQHPPELDESDGVFEIVVFADFDAGVKAVDYGPVGELLAVADRLLHPVELKPSPGLRFCVHPVQVVQDVTFECGPDVVRHLQHRFLGL